MSKHNGCIIPDNWITLENTTIHNEIKKDRAIIYVGNHKEGLHFCSKECLTNYFFHDKTNDDAN